MGICTSCDASSPIPSTIKVILHDGRLQEYSSPVKVSAVLNRTSSSDFFLCNSDEMEFDDVVSAVDSDEELQPGNLYFALPIASLRRPLLPEEMAALAVKANAALLKKCRQGTDLVFAEKDLKNPAPIRKGRRNADGGGGGGRRSRRLENPAKLTAIPE